MPRTTWQDLADDGADRPDPQRLADEARAEAGLPGSLDEIPGLQSLLAERRRLQGVLDRLTGRGEAATSPDAERDARRFPMPEREAPRSPLDGRRAETEAEREREEARRAMELETIDERRARRREETRRLDAGERAVRRRRAGEDRVANAARAWERHRENLIAARDTARDVARLAGALGLPGSDVLERATRRIDDLTSGLDRLSRSIDGATRADARPSGRRERADDIGRYRDLARDAARLAEDVLRDTEAGRRLRALREELAPPPLRRLTGEDDAGTDVDSLERRRQRALDALRERRDDAASTDRRSGATARRSTEPTVD